MVDLHDTEQTPDRLDLDQGIGRRAAVGFLVVAAAGVIVGPLLTAANLIVALVSGRTPNMEQAPGVTTFEKWQHNLPIDVPWWVYLAISLALAVLLVVVWAPQRHYLEFWRRKVILVASPRSLALGALVWAITSFGFGGYYGAPDEWVGFDLMPPLVAVAIVIVALVHQHRLDRRATTRKRRRPQARMKNG